MCSHYLRRDLITSPLMQKKPVLLQKQDIYCGYVLQLLRSSGNYLYFILIHSYNFILAPAKFIFRLHNYSSALISSFYNLYSANLLLRSANFILYSSNFVLHSAKFLCHFAKFLCHSAKFPHHSAKFLHHSAKFLRHSLLNFSGILC